MRTTAAFSRHTLLALLEALLIAVILGSILAVVAGARGTKILGVGDAYAGRTTVASSIELNRPLTVAAGSWPRLGSWVTYTTTYPKTIKAPRIAVDCYQDGVLVYGEAGSVDHEFQLGGASSDWLENGGPADCTALLFDSKWLAGKQTFTELATTSFAAAGP
jgi:hypothetical protein